MFIVAEIILTYLLELQVKNILKTASTGVAYFYRFYSRWNNFYFSFRRG